MLKQITLALAFFICIWGRTNHLQAQITDDFSDGNFTENPAWTGETGEFSVNAAGELQLNAPDAGSSVLAVGGAIPDSAVWLLRIRLEFAPSATNLLRIYLMAEQADLPATNGYYLEIGENGSADALRFYRQDGAARALLSTGIPGFVANEPVDIRLRVKRSTAGTWSVEAATGNGAFEVQGSAADATYLPGPNRFFGLYCLYTATRKDKFFFDDLSILPDVPDQTPPVLLSAAAEDAGTVIARFDEALDSLSALEPAHYGIAGAAAPVLAVFADANRREVRLTLPAPLGTGAYVLEASQVADTSGNVSGFQTAGFQYLNIEPAAEFDILINEIMADPTPLAGLPDAEWVELYNRGNKVIDLNGLRFSDGGTPAVLPAYLLFPDSFVVLSSASGAAALATVTPKVLAVSGFPSLNNEADPLVLAGPGGEIIDQVSYSIGWHTDAAKADGGWTLERVNPGTPCLAGENWQSCPTQPGGTPGRRNAAFSSAPDNTGPRLLAAFPENTVSIKVTFTEGLDKTAAATPAAYQLQPSRTIASATLSAADRREVLLTLADPLQGGVVYALTAAPVLTDCSGNAVTTTDTLYFGLPEAPAPADIVVNELLFNPATGGSDYVELYNRSNKIFSWPEFSLANMAGSGGPVNIPLNRLFFPGEYAVFTANPADVSTRFAQVLPERLFLLPLPSLPDDSGNITLFWSKGGNTVAVDSFNYSADLHNALLSSAERDGVALERIRPEGLTNDPANWTSAAGAFSGGAGTPTRPNSQRGAPGSSADDLVQLVPARLSPDGDGFEDFLDIRYTLPGAGYAATLTIFDSEGIPVRQLIRQDLPGASGALRWDGEMDDGTPARPGIYILFLEIFNPAGEVQRVKKTFALVRRF